MAVAPSELNSSSIEVLRAEMDDMIAWSNKLRSELDLNYADHFAQMDRLVSLGTRTKIPTRHMLDTLGVQTKSDSNVPSGYRLGTF